MIDLLKNVAYAGLGAAVLTKEKIEEMQKDLIEKGKLSQDEGKNFIDDLLKKSEKAQLQLDKWITDRVEERMRQCNLASRDEVMALERKIDQLREMMQQHQAHHVMPDHTHNQDGLS